MSEMSLGVPEGARVKRSLVILTLNEIEGEQALFDRIPLDQVDEYFVVDGGSVDGTIEFFESRGIKVVRQMIRGRGAAFRLAMKEASGEFVVFFSPDGNEDPTDIPRLFELLEAGSDMAIASRFLEGSRNEEDQLAFPWRAWANRSFSLIANWLWGGGISDTINGYRGFRRSAWDELCIDAPGFVIEYQASIRCMKLQKSVAEIPTIEGHRIGGESTAKSIPTGLLFLRFLLREIRLGRALVQPEEKVKVSPKIIQIIVLLTVSSALLFSFWNIWRFPSDLDGEVIQTSNAVLFLTQARRVGHDAQEFLGNQKKEWVEHGSSAITFDLYPGSSPLSSWLVYWAYRVAGPSVITHNLLQGSLQLLTIGVVFLLGWAMYGYLVGLLSALFLSTSLYFNILSKFGQNPPSLVTTLMLVCCFLLFFLAHKNRSRALLSGATVVLGLIWLNGWIGFTVPPLILFFAVLFFASPKILSFLGLGKSSEKPERFRFELQTYFTALWVAFGIFLLGCYLYSWFFDLPLFVTLKYVYDLAIGRSEQIFSSASALQIRLELLPFVFRCLFIGVIPFTQGRLSHTDQSLPGAPIIETVTAVFFLVGLLIALKRWTLSDRLCLVWIGIGLAAPAFLTWFQPRYMMVTLPAIALLAARAVPPTVVRVEALLKKFSKQVSDNVWIFIVPVLIFNAVSTGYAYFGTFASWDGYLLQHFGQAKVGRLISQLAEPEEALVVLGERVLVSYESLFFYTGGQHYPFVYWWDDLLSGTLGGRGEDAWLRLSTWEQNILKEKKKIFYVFGVGPYYYEQPGWNFYKQTDWSEFRQLHPKLDPVETVYFSSGIPALKVFMVDASTPPYAVFPLSGQPAKLEFTANKESNFDYLETSGPINALSWTANSQSPADLPLTLTPGQMATLTFGPNSRLDLPISFESEAFQRDVYQIENLVQDSEKPCLVLNAEEGLLVYKIVAPAKIDRLTLIAMPNLYHDVNRKNQFKISYSVDGSRYTPFWVERSDGSGRWSRQIKEPYYPYRSTEYWIETFQEIQPRSETVFIAFELSGNPGEVALWGDATQGHPMLISATLDSSELTALTYKKGFNTIDLWGQDAGAKLILGTSGVLRTSKVFESENAPGFTGLIVEDPEASRGLARFAGVKSHVEGLMVYGPGTPIKGGDYVAEFSLKTNDNRGSESIAVLDVYASREGQLLYVTELRVRAIDFEAPDVYQKFYIHFTSEGDESFQYRVLWPREADLWVDQVVTMDPGVLPSALLEKILTRSFEAEELLSFTGRIVEDAQASGSKSRYASATRDVRSLLTYGPGTPLPAGEYVAKFQLKVQNNQLKEVMAVADVTASLNGQTTFNKELPVWGREFKKVDVYQDFAIAFSTDGRESLQYRVLWLGKNDLWVDRVQVVPTAKVE